MKMFAGVGILQVFLQLALPGAFKLHEGPAPSMMSVASLEQMEESLWDGLDSVPHWFNESFAGVETLESSHALEQHGKSKYKKVQISGMFDSGTNLVYKTLRLNFPTEMDAMCRGGGHCYWDKHAAPNDNAEHLEDDMLIIQMVRSPVSQLSSWKKAPYALEECAGMWSRSCDTGGVSYRNVADVWNKYTGGYDRLVQQRDNAIVVEYERLVIEPEAVINRIASLLDLSLPGGKVRILSSPAKTHGAPVGRQAALAKIKDMTYKTGNQGLCSEFDSAPMLAHKIPASPPRNYAADCD